MTVQQHEMTIGDALELISRELPIEDRSTRPQAYYQNRRVICPNGWHVSCGFGHGHHCTNYGPPPRRPKLIEESELQDLLRTPDCEVAIMWPDMAFYAPHRREVWDNVPAPVLLAVVDAVAQYREGGPCPCPDCVRERMTAKGGQP